MSLDFIDIFDLTAEKDEGHYRKSHFSFGGKRDIPNSLRVSGVLNHNTVITFDKKNAQKMIELCQKIIDSDNEIKQPD